MPMPHRTFVQVAKRRLVGKEGRERVRAIRELLAELPDYRSGPYADLRKWLNGGDRADARAREGRPPRLDRRSGARAPRRSRFVGPPNAGKSSLLQALSAIQIKTGDYAFTTTRPVAALTRIGGVLVQLVEIPGLIEGANEDRGGGRALLGVLRNADAIVFCHAASAPPEELAVVREEVAAAGIDLPALVVATKATSEARGGSLRVPDLELVPVSVLDDESLDRLREAIWALTGLVRVFLRHGRRGRRRAARAAPGRDGRGRRGRDPPRARGDVHGRPRLGPVGALRRPARRPRARRGGRRRRGDRALAADHRDARRHRQRRSASTSAAARWPVSTAPLR